MGKEWTRNPSGMVRECKVLLFSMISSHHNMQKAALSMDFQSFSSLHSCTLAVLSEPACMEGISSAKGESCSGMTGRWDSGSTLESIFPALCTIHSPG